MNHAPTPRALLVAAAVLLLAVAPPRATAEIVLTGVLDAATAGVESPATGFARLVLDDTQTVVTYEITYENLQGVEFEAHLHPGPPGTFEPPVHHLPLGTPKHGTWEPSPRRVAELLAGEISVFIHTDLYPEGEIAGWVSVESTAVERGTWARIKAMYR